MNVHKYRLDGAKLETVLNPGNGSHITTYGYDAGGSQTSEQAVTHLQNSQNTWWQDVPHHSATYTLNERGQRRTRTFTGNLSIFVEQRGASGEGLGTANHSTFWEYDPNGNLTSTHDTPQGTSLRQNLFTYLYSPTNKETYHSRDLQVKRKSAKAGTTLWNWGGSEGVLLAASVGEGSATYNDRDLIASTRVTDRSPVVGSTEASRHTVYGKLLYLDTTYAYFASGVKKSSTVSNITSGGTRTSSLTTTDQRGRPREEVDDSGNKISTTYTTDGTTTKQVKYASGAVIHTERSTPTVGGLTAITSGTDGTPNTFLYQSSGMLQSVSSSKVENGYTYSGGTTYTYTSLGKPDAITTSSSTKDAQNTVVSSSNNTVQHTYTTTGFLSAKSDPGNGANSGTYSLDSLGNRLSVSGGVYDGFTKRYDAEGRVAQFERLKVGIGVFCSAQCDNGNDSAVNSFRYDPMGNQVIASEANLRESTQYNINHLIGRRFNNSVYVNSEVQMIRRRDGVWSFREECYQFGGCHGHKFWGGSFGSNSTAVGYEGIYLCRVQNARG